MGPGQNFNFCSGLHTVYRRSSGGPPLGVTLWCLLGRFSLLLLITKLFIADQSFSSLRSRCKLGGQVNPCWRTNWKNVLRWVKCKGQLKRKWLIDLVLILYKQLGEATFLIFARKLLSRQWSVNTWIMTGEGFNLVSWLFSGTDEKIALFGRQYNLSAICCSIPPIKG